MTYYNKDEYRFDRFEKSNTKNKMYDAILKHKTSDKEVRVPFADSTMENYQDKTGLNLYPHLIHGDHTRRKLFRARHKGFLKPGFYSPSYFSYYFLW